LAASDYRGVCSSTTEEYKEQMRQLVLAGNPYSAENRKEILEYCEEDVRNTSDLFYRMLPEIDWPRALFRGRYMQAVAQMEHRGIPLDTTTLDRLRLHWKGLQGRLVQEIDANYGCYEGLTFKTEKFERYLVEKDIPWPRTEKGNLSLSDDTFKDMVRIYPYLQGLKDLRHLLGSMKLNAIPVGTDGRNRTMLSPFRARTGRNQPSSSKYIFGTAVWLRSLIQPQPGRALIYLDFNQQEFAIAGYLSGDLAMQEAYRSGDPYMNFAIRAGAAPVGATKSSHPEVRALYKQCVLGVLYGMGAHSLALRIKRPTIYAEELLRQHRRVFKTYWEWSDRVLTDALLSRRMTTSFGWRYLIAGENGDAARSIQNWPMQAHGSDILRMACVLLEAHGMEATAPVHDALLLECDTDKADGVAVEAKDIMETAAVYVLGGGRRIRVDHKIIRYPDRFIDDQGRGTETWNRVNRIMDEMEKELPHG
jgi:DNA polymerase I-like protein with 3'-5' exonuclease and polymerase domains